MGNVMSEWAAQINFHKSSFFECEQSLNAQQPWLKSFRDASIARFSELGFPSAHSEEWRFTNISRIMEVPFRRAAPAPKALPASQVLSFMFPEAECIQLVFINGIFSKSHSVFHSLPKGAHIGSLAEALNSHRALIEPILINPRDFGKDPFLALNNAFISHGAFVHIPSQASLPSPVHLLYLSTQASAATISFPRSIILADRGSQASIIESFAGIDGGMYLTNSATEIHMAPGSAIDHYRIQRESINSYHVASLQVFQQQDSSYISHSFSLGGSLVRNNFDVFLNGSGADCALNGLYEVRGRQHVDNHTSIDHSKPHCTSRELYKGILDDTASAVFNGRIVVRKDAQKTNARQTNKNLLLSKHSAINTMPHLEILADDVKCTHGATIGQLNEEELFYLRSRGIDQSMARMLITYGFASELLALLKIKPIQRQMDLMLLNRLFK
jgi:Fe-S cluster assembly protein SufD